MADKFRVTFPIQVSFARGEQPTEAKLNSIASQAKNGLAMVEKAIGDVWNQSGDATMSELPLQIPNLARTLGQQYLANAQFPKPDIDDSGMIVISQDTTNQIGSTILHLDFTPEVGPGSILDDEIAAALALTYRSSLATFTGSGDYFPETSTGRIYLSEPWTEATIQYEVLGEEFPGVASNTSPYNVIPHPEMEGTWKGIKFVYLSANKYLAFLPPRRPLLSNASEIGKIPRATTNSVDPNNNVGYRYWYSAAGDWDSPVDIAADANHLAIAAEKAYRHRLPDYLYDIVTTGSLGQQLPTGTIYLWDNSQETIVEGITFKVPDIDSAYGGGLRPGWVLQVEGSILDSLLGEAVGTSSIDTDDPTDYSAENYSLIVVGESVAGRLSSLSDLAISDDNSTGVAQRIPHENLSYVQPRVRSGSDTYTNIPPSYRKGDDHNYLLSREGSTSTAASQRDRYNNGMAGDLLVLSTASGSNKQNLSASSSAVRFGSMTGPSIRHRYNSTSIAIRNRSSSAITGNNWLVLENSPVFLGRGVLAFGTSTTADSGADGSFPGSTVSGFDCDTTVDTSGTGAWFRCFGDNRVDLSGISTGQLLIVGNSYDVTTGAAADGNAYRRGAGTNFIRIDSTSTENLIQFAGQDLDLSANTADTSEVVIGKTNSSTHLRLTNNRLLFATTGDILNSGGSGFYFRESGATANSLVELGTLRTVNESIQFVDSSARLSKSGSTYSFTHSSAVDNATVNAGYFSANQKYLVNNTFSGTAGRWIQNNNGLSIGAHSTTAIAIYTAASGTAKGSLLADDITLDGFLNTGENVTAGTYVQAATTITAGGDITSTAGNIVGVTMQPSRTNVTPSTDAHLYEYTRRKALVCSVRVGNNTALSEPIISSGSFNVTDVELHSGTDTGRWRITFDHPIPNLDRAVVSLTPELNNLDVIVTGAPAGTWIPSAGVRYRDPSGEYIDINIYLQRSLTLAGDLIIKCPALGTAEQFYINMTIHGYH